MPEPTRTQTLSLLRLGPTTVERLTETFLNAKLAEYRATLSELRVRYGGPARVYLSTEIRDALLAEAERDAASVARTYNRLIEAEAGRSPLKGQLLFDHLAAYARERGRVRAPMIARSEVAPARLDATVSFYRENGVEPEFDFVGPPATCPICKALKATNPHTFAEVLAIGLPHLQCRHRWRGRVYSAAKLSRGGLRPGMISAGAGGTAGIVGSEDLRSKLSGLTEETIAEAIHAGEIGGLAKAFDEAEHPRDPLTGRWIHVLGADLLLGELSKSLDDIPTDEPTQPSTHLDEVYRMNQETEQSFRELLDLGGGLEERLGADALVNDDLAAFENAAAKLDPSTRPVVVIAPMKRRAAAEAKLERKPYGPEGLRDLNRASVLLRDLGDLPLALEALRRECEARGWTIHDPENGFSGRASNGYRDLAFHLVSPDGVVTEFQFHLGEMWDAKFSKGGHELYERSRAFDALKQKRDLTPAEREQLAELAQRQHDLYDGAWISILEAAGRPPPSRGDNALGAREVDAAEFRAALKHALAGPDGAYLTDYSKDDLADMRTFLSADGKVGGAITPDGEIVSVFRLEGGPKGAGSKMVEYLLEQGGVKIFCTGEGLRAFYESLGFRVVARHAWNDNLAPDGWDYERHGRPWLFDMVHDPRPPGSA